MKTGNELTIRHTSLKGQGVFVSRNFKKGCLIVRGRVVKKVDSRTNYSFQVGPNQHVDLDVPARLINHSCDPNLGIKNNEFGGYDFFALKKIKAGEELTWDYCMSEYVSIAIKDRCSCGSESCRIKISGYRGLPIEIRKKYNGFIADYLKG